MGSYIPLNGAPTIARMEEALGKSAKGVDIMLLGDLNVRLQEPRNATVVAACGLEDMTDHFLPRRRYRGGGR